MALYLFLQTEEKSKWHPALASERDNIIKNRKPALVSVLNVDNSFETDLTLEEARSLKYDGPAYFDFDAEDIEEATTQFKAFLSKLKAKSVNLDMCRLYATGKKGYHIEIPQVMLMGKAPPTGVPHLPDIYREVAHSLFVETLDLRVYSSRRGRMWRCPDVKRADNGKYKVQISAEEALNIDPEKYAELCSAPRGSLSVEPPTLNPELGLLFAQARDRVDAAVSKRRSKKAAVNQLLKFQGEWPETMQLILQDVAIKPGVGWNLISMQLAIVASELGKTEDQLLADAEGILGTHESDSTRYNTYRKRALDLREMFRYVSGNPCYEYSVGAVLALLLPEVRANADIAFGDYVPEATEEPERHERKEGEPPKVVEEKTTDELIDKHGHLRINKSGMFAKFEDGFRNICDLGLSHPTAMALMCGEFTGYEVNVTLDGKSPGKKFIPMSALASRSQLNAWTLLLGASMRGNEQHVCTIADTLRLASKAILYAVEREGIDVVTPPSATKDGDEDVIWVSPEDVICLREGYKYRYRSPHRDGPTYRSDLMTAAPLTTDDGAFIQDLLSINTDRNLAKLLGWFSAAFLTQLIRRKFRRFPLLQVYGQAGAGKSMTVILLNHLHYNQHRPTSFAVAGLTQFPIITAVAASASIPVIFEEMKRRQLNAVTLNFIQNILRSNYTADHLSRGSMGRDKSVRELTVTDYTNGAPIAFVGEALEDQSAILERCVTVAMSKTDKAGRDAPFTRCMSDATTMGRIGKALATAAMVMDRKWLEDSINDNLKAVCGQINNGKGDDSSRPAFNLAVTLTGLEFLKQTLKQVFGARFDEKLVEFQQAILYNVMDAIPSNMSEASRVLDTIANLTRHEDDAVAVVHGRDYMLDPDGRHIEIKLRNVYDRYVRYQRGLGLEVLFDSHTAFQTAMNNYGGLTARACPGSPLFDSPRAAIYQFDLEYLDKEGINSFKP